MKAEEIERLRKQQASIVRPVGDSAAEARSGAKPPTPSLPIAPIVVVTREGGNEGDRLTTQQLLEASRQGDGYKCLRCTFETPDPEAMIDHLAEEINQAMLRIGNLPARDPGNRGTAGSAADSDIKPAPGES